MGIFDFLKRKPAKKTKVATPKAATQKSDTGGFRQEIVGESFHQKELQKICGRRTEEGENRIVEARIILDNKNPKDDQAVRIEIAGHTVGHLSHEDARAYRARLKRERRADATVTCRAKIKGGWKRKGSTGSYGVSLDIPALS